MPIYTYKCTDGHKFDELVKYGADTIPCLHSGCTCLANRGTVYVVATVGPVSEGLESYNQSLLSTSERMNGVELKTKRQIEQYQESKGLVANSIDSPMAKRIMSDQLDDTNDITKLRDKEGQTAAVDYVYKTELTRSTGWNNAEYSNWKRGHDAAVKYAESGSADLSTANGRATSKSST